MPGSSYTLLFEPFGATYRLRESLKQVMVDASSISRITPLNNWIKGALASQLESIRVFVNMLRQNWYRVKVYFKKVATKAFAECGYLNIQEIKRTDEGYRNIQNCIVMIYFRLGRLELKMRYE